MKRVSQTLGIIAGTAWLSLSISCTLVLAQQTPVSGLELTAQEYLNKASSVRGPERLELLSKAIAVDSKYADAYLSRGVYLYRIKDYQLADEDFKKVIELGPCVQGSDKRFTDLSRCGEAYFYSGLIHYERKQYKEALAKLDEYYRIRFSYGSPGYYADAMYYRGMSRIQTEGRTKNLAALGDFSRAIIDKQFQLVSQGDALSYKERAVIRHELGDKEGARSDLRRAADLFLDKYANVQLYKETIDILNRL